MVKNIILKFCQAAAKPSLKESNERIPVNMPRSTQTRANILTSLVIPLA